MSEPRVTEWTLDPISDEDDPNIGVWAVKVIYRGHGLWSVSQHGRDLHKIGSWDYAPQPSSRTDAWKAKHRFTEDEALRLARLVLPTITVNGHTAESWAAHLPAAAGDDPAGRDGEAGT